MVILGAVIGVIAGLLAQVAGHYLSRRREHLRDVRKLAAKCLALGRPIQTIVGNTRAQRSEKIEMVEQLAPLISPFVEAAYELKWIAPERLAELAEKYQDAVAGLIDDWDAETDGYLDAPLAEAANRLEAEVAKLVAPRRSWLKR